MKKLITSAIITILLIVGLLTQNKEKSKSIVTNFKVEYNYQKSLEIPSYIQEATILEKHGFTIGFSKKYKNAYWVAYKLDCKETNGKIERSNYFREDEILGKYSPSTNDYYASGYDKGHLIPAGDNNSDSLSMHDSFLMSNVSPQKPAFNRGIWKKLESQVRKWACEYDSLYIITGPVLKKGLSRLGKGKVAIPKYFYKSILVYSNKNQSMISFYMSQNTKDENLFDFVITTDSLESILGYDLFPNLDDKIEKSLESQIDTTFWELK